MIEFVSTVIFSFVSTEIDNILVMTVLFAQSDRDIKKIHVVAGQYLALGILTAMSILGAYGLTFVPQEYIGFFGLIPIALGVKEYVSYKRDRREKSISAIKSEEKPTAKKAVKPISECTSSSGVISIALVALANGADNIGIYIPIFARYSFGQLIAVIAIFTVMMALWCLLAEWLTRFPIVKAPLQKYKHYIVPAVFIGLGLYILLIS